MWMPLRAPKMNGFIFGFQRLVWWPKWTPASSSWRMVIGGRSGRTAAAWRPWSFFRVFLAPSSVVTSIASGSCVVWSVAFALASDRVADFEPRFRADDLTLWARHGVTWPSEAGLGRKRSRCRKRGWSSSTCRTDLALGATLTSPLGGGRPRHRVSARDRRKAALEARQLGEGSTPRSRQTEPQLHARTKSTRVKKLSTSAREGQARHPAARHGRGGHHVHRRRRGDPPRHRQADRLADPDGDDPPRQAHRQPHAR